MPKKDEQNPFRELPTKDRETLQGGDFAPEGLRGGPPPPDGQGPSPVAPSAKTVATGGIPSASVLGADDAPDKDEIA